MPVRFDHGTLALAEAEFFRPKPEAECRGDPVAVMGSRIVEALARVGWDVPGIDVVVATLGKGEDVVRYVSSVSGMTDDGPYAFRFHAPQGLRKGARTALTGLSEVAVPPGLEMRWFDDGSGPTLHLYVGRDWAADGAEFLENFKIDAKLRRQPRTYLTYSGQGRGGRLRPVAAGREYAPRRAEPKWIAEADVVRRIQMFVHRFVEGLAALPAAPGCDDVSPAGDANMRRLAAVERIPAPPGFPKLFAMADRDGAWRMRHPDELDGAERYALPGNGFRLSHRVFPGVPAAAFRGFGYATPDPAAPSGHPAYGRGSEAHPSVIELKWLNEVYVVDEAAYETARAAALAVAEREGRRLTEDEMDAAVVALAATMVPAAEYHGGFARPKYLIGRQLGRDEARLVTGDVGIFRRGEGAAAEMRVEISDDATGAVFTVFERSHPGERAAAVARRTAAEFAEFHLAPGRCVTDRLDAPEPGPAADQFNR